MSNSFLDLKSGLGITFILVKNVNPGAQRVFVMGKTVLIVSSSPRKNGNSETLWRLSLTAREAGHSVETVRLREKQMGFCRGCLAWLKVGGVASSKTMPWKLPPKCTMRMCWCLQRPSTTTASAAQNHAGPANPTFGSDYAFTEAYLLAMAAERNRRSTFDGAKKRRCKGMG